MVDKKKGTEPVAMVLLALAALLGALILLKVAGFFVTSADAENTVAQATSPTGAEPNDVERPLAEAKSLADQLKKKNLFAPPPPKQHPVKQVDGILGSEALIGGKRYAVGDKIGEARIVAITATEVRIEWDGKEKTFAPFASASATPPPRQKPSKPEEKRPEPPKPGPQAAPVEVKTVAAPVETDPLAWMGVDLPANVKKKLLEHWNNMSDEEKEKGKEEWNNMSDDQKQQAVAAMEQNL